MEGGRTVNNEPDGFLGAVLATQSVTGLKALINGPGGCRSRALNMVRELSLSYGGEDQCCCQSQFMSRISLMPCMYLNEEDIILGSGPKITEGLADIISKTGSDVVLIDTLGATVQVVDREEAVAKSGFADKVILTDEDLSDLSFSEGFDDTLLRILQHYIGGPAPVKKTSVNILGYSMADRSWDFGKREIIRMLALLGVEVVAFVGCDTSVTDLRNSAGAEMNILIHPEFSIRTACWYKERFGIDYLIPSEGTPVGYDSIRSFVKEVAFRLHVNAADALEYIDREENSVCAVIRNYDRFANSLRSSSMALEGVPSDVLPIAKLLYGYFNLFPCSVRLRHMNGNLVDNRVLGFLKYLGREDALGGPRDFASLRVLMSDGLTCDAYAIEHPETNCIGICLPFRDTVPLTDRCLVGFSGTRNILDAVMNGIGRFICGQPIPADFR